MRKATNRIERYIDGYFDIIIIETDLCFEAWIHHEQSGTSKYMFGVSRYEHEWNEFLEVVETNLEEYERIWYLEEVDTYAKEGASMKFYVTDVKAEGNEWIILVTEDLDEAIEAARNHWNSLTSHDKKRSTIEVRVYKEDVEDDDCFCFDYDTVSWQEAHHG